MQMPRNQQLPGQAPAPDPTPSGLQATEAADMEREHTFTRLYASGIMGGVGDYEIEIRRRTEDPEAALSSTDGHVCTVTNSRLPGRIEGMAGEIVKRWNQAPTLKAENERLRAALEQMTNALEVASTSPQSGPFKMDLQGSREVFAAIAKTGRATLTK